MTEADEIRKHADEALAKGEITRSQWLDVQRMLIQDKIEKIVLAKYPEAKGQTK